MQNVQEINWLLEILKLTVPSVVVGLFSFGVQFLIAYRLWNRMKDYEGSVTADLKSYEFSLNKKLEDYKKEIDKDRYQFQTKFSAFHQKQFEVAGELFGLFTDLRYKIDTFARNQTGVNELNNKLKEFEEMFWRNRFYFDEELCGKIEEQRMFWHEILNSFTDLGMYSSAHRDAPSVNSLRQLQQAEDEMRTKFNEMKKSYTDNKTLLEPEFRKLVSTEKSEIPRENSNRIL
jgi:hypothetical protein